MDTVKHRERVEDLKLTLTQKEKALNELWGKYHAVNKRLSAALSALSQKKVKVVEVEKKPQVIQKHIIINRKTSYLLNQDLIIDTVCEYFNVTRKQLESKRRDRDIVVPRHFACYLLATHTLLTLKAIGRLFGNRDHTTVGHGMRRTSELLEDDGFNDLYELLHSKLKQAA